MINKIIEITKELYKTLEHKDGARTEEFHFFGYYDNELTFCIKFIYEFGTPLLLICRGTGGESICESLEYYPEYDGITHTIYEFLNEYDITVTEIWIYNCNKDWNKKFLNDITNNQFEDERGYIEQLNCIVEKQDDNIRYFTEGNEADDFEECYERYWNSLE